MLSSTTSYQLNTAVEDVLAHLPVSASCEYGAGSMIYGPDNNSQTIYLVMSGTVGISHVAGIGREVLLEIVRPDDLFGVSAFLDAGRHSECARVIQKARLMTWPVADMENLVMTRPRLAIAFLQLLAQRGAEFSRRIESLAVENIEQRLARSLIRLSERLGTSGEDGTVRMMPLTHEMLSQYVGTSREVVTKYMNRFRMSGCVSYSRQGMIVYRGALEARLQAAALPPCRERQRSAGAG